jgi:hypothetical protein
MVGQFPVHDRPQLRVERGQDLRESLVLGDPDPAHRQRLGHLQADVPGPDHDRGPWKAILQGPHHREQVAHRVQQVHPVLGADRARAGQTPDRRADADRARPDHQGVIAHLPGAPVRPGQLQAPPLDVDAGGAGVQAQADPGGLQIGTGAVGQLTPIRYVTADVVGDTADGEVRVRVGHHHGDLDPGIEFTGSERGTDPGVAAAHGDQMHDHSSSPGGC